MGKRSRELKQLDIILNRADRRAVHVLHSVLWLRGSKVSAVRRPARHEPPPAVLRFGLSSPGLAPPSR